MPRYRYICDEIDSAHWDRPLPPLSEEFAAENDEAAKRTAADILAAIKAAPNFEGINFEKLVAVEGERVVFKKGRRV